MKLGISEKPAVISDLTLNSGSAVALFIRSRLGPGARLVGLGAACLSALGCGSLFGNNTPQPTPTSAFISPAVSFPSGLDCSNAGAQPISVSWDVKPIQLDSGTVGATTEFANQEMLANTGGSPTDCYYTPLGGASSIAGASLRPDLGRLPMNSWLRHEGVDLALLAPWLGDAIPNDSDLALEVAEDAAYAPYLARQEAELRDLRAGEGLELAQDFPYAAIPGLSREMVERLQRARPATLAAAGRVPGVTPAALAALLVHARRQAA